MTKDHDPSHDPLMAALGAEARRRLETEERQRLDARWDKYCAGRLEEAQIESLLSEKTTDEHRLAASLFEPLSSGDRSSMVARLGQEIGHRESSPSDRRGAEPVASGKSWIDWLPWWLQSRKQGLGWGLAGAFAMLLALTLVPRFLQEPMPGFALQIQGDQQQRSAPSEHTPSEKAQSGAHVIRADGRSRLRLQPEEPISGPLHLSIFARSPDGDLRPWDAAESALTHYPDGTSLAEDLEWPWGPGHWTLIVVASRDPLSDREARRLLEGDRSSAALPPTVQLIEGGVFVQP